MNPNYYYLLNLISDLTDNKNKQIIKNNIDKLSLDFSNLSKFITKYIDITSNKNLNKKQKISKIQNIGYLNNKFSKKQATQIYKTINFENIKGGSVQEKNLNNLKNEFDGSVNFCLKELPIMIIKLFFTPKYLFLAVSSFFAWLAELFDFEFDSEGWLDFSQNIDWIYLFLFITASIPFLGQIPNFIIIIRALIDGKYFLAIINTLTTILSIIFTLHLVDLGLIFKIFYYFDAVSYNNELNKLENDKIKNLEYKNNLDQTVKFTEKTSYPNNDLTKNRVVNQQYKDIVTPKQTIIKKSIDTNNLINKASNKVDSSIDNASVTTNNLINKASNKVDSSIDNASVAINNKLDTAETVYDNTNVKKLRHLRKKLKKINNKL